MAVYKISELVGASGNSYAEATRTAIEKAQKTLRNVDWWEVVEQRGAIRDGSLEYQVKLKIGFRLED